MSPERDPKYQQFLNTVNGKNGGQYDPNEDTIATPEEIGWWKQFQVRRALRHFGSGHFTQPEFHLLESHNIVHVSPTRRKYLEKSFLLKQSSR